MQKIMCGYTTPISKFKSNPGAALSEAQGDAIAVSSNNKIMFYAVPAALFEEMSAFCEYAQRGATEQINVPAKFSDVDLDKIAKIMSEKLKKETDGDFEEWP